MEKLVESMKEIREGVKELKVTIEAREIRKQQIRLVIDEFKPGKASVTLRHDGEYVYNNNHTFWATASRFVDSVFVEEMDLQEACQMARKIKAEFAKITGNNLTLKFYEYLDLDFI